MCSKYIHDCRHKRSKLLLESHTLSFPWLSIFVIVSREPWDEGMGMRSGKEMREPEDIPQE